MTTSVRDCNKDITKLLSTAKDVHIRGFQGVNVDYTPTPLPPLWLTDRHLAIEYRLERVVLVEDVLSDMTQDFDHDILRYLADNEKFPAANQLPTLKRSSYFTIEGPGAFEFIYGAQIGLNSILLASNMYIHPNQQTWCSPFFLQQLQPRPVFLNQSEVKLFEDRRKLCDFGLSEDVVSKINSSVIDKLRIIRDGHNCLATINFLPICPESDDIVAEVLSYDPHDWKVSDTVSPTYLEPFNRSRPVDRPNTWWSTYKSPAKSNSNQIKRTRRKKILLPPRKGTRNPLQPSAAEFVQRAWCRAVETDATFLVFNSGSKERIGIRHRATNTLFISPVIDPFNKPYMMYHMALHAAILKDAIARTSPQPHEDTSTLTGKRKQRQEQPSARTRCSKRLKGEPPTQHENIALDIRHEISSRHILLISFDFDVYHSTAPSTFLRISPFCHPDFLSSPFQQLKPNRSYPMSKYMHFTAREKIGDGRTGTAFRGVLRIQTGSGHTIESKIVLKIPLGAQPTKNIHDEYRTYTELALAGVTEGLVQVYGVFEDIETGAIAMMMDDGGTDLWRREQERSGMRAGQITLSQVEFDTLHRIIQRINMAGLLHFDIKPNNILIDADGKLSVIDFDSAWPREWKDGGPTSSDLLTLRDLFAQTFVKDKHYPRS
ncbi:hypothetical protein BJ165DRAFT_1529579 [Panaeolus papilionaceus]|nr:hypothetical protein BJ165DRAFT_1529579 [Panaeolus papilionaceus]